MLESGWEFWQTDEQAVSTRPDGQERPSLQFSLAAEEWSGHFFLRRSLEILRLPAHGCGDAGAAAGVIVEEKLLDWTGIEFAILSQHQIHICLAIRLASGIQAVHVSFIFHGARDRVGDRGHDKKEYGEHDYGERQNGYVRDSADAPLLSPARESGPNSPIQKCEADHDHDSDHDQSLVSVVQNAVAHLVSHGGLDLGQSAALQKVVV